MTTGGKQFLAIVLFATAIGSIILFFDRMNHYEQDTETYGFNDTFDRISGGTGLSEADRPVKPTFLPYGAAAGAALVGMFVAFNSAANDNRKRKAEAPKGNGPDAAGVSESEPSSAHTPEPPRGRHAKPSSGLDSGRNPDSDAP